MLSEAVTRANELGDEALVMHLRGLESRRRELEAETAEALAELDRRKANRVDGHASMWGLLRATVGWSDRECRERMRIARLVAAFPDVGEVLADGQASTANVAEIARGFANPRCGDEIESVLGTLLTEACRMEHDDLRIVVRRWETLADIDGSHRDAQAGHERRNAHCGVWDGIGQIAAEWGEVDGLANREIFDRFCEAEFRSDWEATVAEHGDAACVALMPRTDAQRRADAVTAIFAAAVTAPADGRRPVPVLNVFVDHETFTGLLVEREFLPHRFVDPFESGSPLATGRRCETEHGDPVDPVTALQIALEGHLRFVILDDVGVPIRWGRDRRLFEGAARDAVMCLSHRCTHPGCRIPSRRSQADHTKPWSQGGRTDPGNGGPKCKKHNLLGNQGYATSRDHRGRWHVHRPDATEIP